MGIETPVLLNRVTGSAFQGKCGLTEAFPQITTRIFFKGHKIFTQAGRDLGLMTFRN